MDADGSNAGQVTANGVPEYGAELSPDNRRVLFRADSDTSGEFYYNDKVYLAPADGGAYRLLAADFPPEASQAVWGADGTTVLVQANTGVRQELFSLEVATGAATRLTRGDHSVSLSDYRPAIDRAAVTVTGPSEPGDVWVMELEQDER